jgi:DNA/RNA endonuclease G (NUC1)
MRSTTLSRWLAAAALMMSTLATAQVRISEIHYDNASTDVGEAIEVSAPAGTDLTGWSLVLYNGSTGASYDTDPLPAGAVPATCGARGVVVVNYPSNGIQNGSPDAIALVDGANTVVEFISYEGVFAATNGPAMGLTSVDIGAMQNGTEAVGMSLRRDVAGLWAPGTSTFGACNDDGVEPPDPEVASVAVSPPSVTVPVGASVALSATAFDLSSAPISGVPFLWDSSNPAVATVSATGVVIALADGDTVVTATAPNNISGSSAIRVATETDPPVTDFRINEIHYDNSGTDAGEAVEIEGPAGASVDGFSIVLYNGNGGIPYGTPQLLSGTLLESCTERGVAVVTYPQDGLQNGAPDGIALLNASGDVLDFISYEGPLTALAGPAAGLTATDILASQTNAPLGTSLQRLSTGVWDSGLSSFGACNPDSPVPPTNTILITGREAGDAPLPVGYEDQLFGQLRSPGGVTIPTTFTWVSETPAIATIGQNGVFRALAAGTAIFRATAADGTTSTIALPTHVGEESATAQYGNNTEFGEPTDADSSDDILVRRREFTSSYSPVRNSPNWVAYAIDATHFGAQDRCDCFTMDPELPSSLPQITTDDYTGSGAIAGYGIDRGHLARSFDRTSASLDNARTFLFTNIVPQASDQNQGPWAQFENHLGDFARLQDREVYVIAGVAGNKGSLKNLGLVTIPTHTWKVALILPRDQGLADVDDYRDVEAIAVIMPNDPGIRNVPWQDYLRTIDEVETLSGYDVLALLPDAIEAAVESGTQPPIAAVSGPAGSIEVGGSVTLNASGSLDPNGSIVSYEWNFGDGTVASGVSVAHEYAQDGVYNASVTVTDNDGLTGTAVFAVIVTNAAPVIGAVPGGNVNVGAPYTVEGTFADPGADAWTATVDWGDGSAPSTASLASRAFSLTHTYATPGAFTVSVTIADDDTATTTTHTVLVAQPAPGLDAALPLIDQLVADGKISRTLGLLFKAQVIAAKRLLERGNTPAAVVILKSLVVQIDLLVRLHHVTAADMAPLRSLLVQTIATLGGQGGAMGTFPSVREHRPWR